MFLFLLTARGGRLSANYSARRHRSIPQTRHVRILPAPVDLCVSGLSPSDFPDTKPAIVRAINIGTNSRMERESSGHPVLDHLRANGISSSGTSPEYFSISFTAKYRDGEDGRLNR